MIYWIGVIAEIRKRIKEQGEKNKEQRTKSKDK
jgi:hypothetical protein